MALATQQKAEAAPERILVLDDDPEICELTQAYLQQQGFAVDTVQSGEALNAYLKVHRVDLLVLDLMLPGEHGLSIAQRLKKERLCRSIPSPVAQRREKARLCSCHGSD